MDISAQHEAEPQLKVLQFNDPLQIVAELAESLAAGDSLWGQRQIIVIPSPAYRQWLEEELVSRMGVLIGVEFCALDQLPDALATGGRRAPLPVEIGAAIENRLRAMWATTEQGAAPHQARTLTYLFGQYGLYGQQLLQQWPQNSPMAVDQQQLWQSFFKNHTEVMPLVARLATHRAVQNVGCVHLVAQSSTPPAWLTWLAAISHNAPVTLYHLCATPLWMGDTLSSKQLSSNLRRLRELGLNDTCYQMQLQQILERQPLLADLGRVPRIFQRDITELWENAWSEEHHTEQTVPTTTLDVLRADLATITCSTDKADISNDLYNHVCRSRLHEVHVCLKQIINYMQAHPGTAWHDIVVACANPQVYRPLIEGVVAARQLNMPMRWVDGGFRGPVVDWLLQALELVLGRWAFIDIERLLLHPAIATCHNWGAEELTALHRMLLSLNIWWGENAEHRQQWLMEHLHNCDENSAKAAQGTWWHALQQAITALLQDPQQQLLSPELWPCIDQLLQTVLALRNLRMQLTGTSSLSVADAATAVSEFVVQAGVAELSQADDILRLLKSISHNQILLQYPLPPSSALQWLASTLDSLHQNNQSPGIWAGGMSALRGIGCRAMFILGLDEESFPTPWNPEPFNLLEGKERYPSRGDYDRLCLLECLLCAREHLEMFATIRPGSQVKQACHAVQAIVDAADAITGTSCTTVHSWELCSPEIDIAQHTPCIQTTPRERRITPEEFCRDLQQPLRCYLRHAMRFRNSRTLMTEPIECSSYQRARMLLDRLKGLDHEQLLPRGRLQELVEQIPNLDKTGLSEVWLGEVPSGVAHPIMPCSRWSAANGLQIEGALGWADADCLLLPLGSQERSLRQLPKLCLWSLICPNGSYGDLLDSNRRWPLPKSATLETLELLAELHALAQQHPLPSSIDELISLDAHQLPDSWQKQLQALTLDPHHEPPVVPARVTELCMALQLSLKSAKALGTVDA